jgi:hypothetical protein
MGTGALPPVVKRPGREVDHSPPASAEAKKMWIYTSIPPYTFMVYCLISQAQEQFTFLFNKGDDLDLHLEDAWFENSLVYRLS